MLPPDSFEGAGDLSADCSAFTAFKKAMISWRSDADLMPGMFMDVPGTSPLGSSIQASSFSSLQTKPEALSASLYRPNPSTVAAFRPATVARLGPVLWRSGRAEWQDRHCTKAFRPRSGSPSARAVPINPVNKAAIIAPAMENRFRLISNPPHVTCMTPIMPPAWCSRMWQWNIQPPGLSATKAISTCSRGAIRTVSCHSL